ncbi:MAG: hypothetical protein J2P15_02150 [Micromonosporaceae bacterium]|nr:hypothetical protein [Micromonosporaceae bacterium]
MLLSVHDRAHDQQTVLDSYLDGVVVGYSTGPPFGQRLITFADLERIGQTRRQLRYQAASNLDGMLASVSVHGVPPALMVSFGGIESSLVLADPFWDSLAGSVPGELVIGVPARDVVIITGSRSPSGIAKVQRAVDRIFLAKGEHLLLRDLLTWRGGRWDLF